MPEVNAPSLEMRIRFVALWANMTLSLVFISQSELRIGPVSEDRLKLVKVKTNVVNALTVAPDCFETLPFEKYEASSYYFEDRFGAGGNNLF